LKKPVGSREDWKERPFHDCAACGKRAQGLSNCGGCKSARYCDEVCAKNHWKAHKPDCKALAAAKKKKRERRAKKKARAGVDESKTRE